MQIFFSEFPFLFVAVVFLLALLIGSFLNVVIYRLPIMMEREWREQCAELASTPASQPKPNRQPTTAVITAVTSSMIG